MLEFLKYWLKVFLALFCCRKKAWHSKSKKKAEVANHLHVKYTRVCTDDPESASGGRVLTAREGESDSSGSPLLLHMHRPHLRDRFGELRFRTTYDSQRQLLLVTVIDARDLPPMDTDGKADPYVEVSLRPPGGHGGGQKKHTTAIKHNCLNPTFNETAEFQLTPDDIGAKDLVLKVLDSDYPLQDELIGVIRLPLSSLLGFSPRLVPSTSHHTCLILHEKNKNGESMDVADAAKLNLRVSQQAQENQDLVARLRETRTRLETLQEENGALRTEKLMLEMRQFRSLADGDDDDGEDDRLAAEGRFHRSAPVSKGASPVPPAPASSKPLQLLSHLQSALAEKDEEIAKLRGHIGEMRPRLELLSSRNGQIDLALSYFLITERLRVDVLSAHNLRAVNLGGKDSDPFAKVRVFRQRPGQKVERWKFETKTVWKALSPVWNERFVIPDDIKAEDLPHMNVEIVVLDRGRVRSTQPLGKLVIGPDQPAECCRHWEEMLRHHGEIIKMTHALSDV